MTAPLARDQHGNSLDLPPDAAYWRVRRHTGGRPSTVLGPDGEPLFLPIAAERNELRAYGCNGSIRLEAVDSDYRPVKAPVAFVELGAATDDGATRGADASIGHPDLVRTSLESLARTVEAMQRTQIERERAIAQKDRALTDAQVEMQRRDTQLIIALLEHATGGKPQDALTMIKQQFAIQKALEDGTAGKTRNAGTLQVTPAVAPEGEGTAQTVAKYAAALAPWVPHMGEAFATAVAGDDPAKAAGIRRNAGMIAGLMGGVASMVGGQPVVIPQPMPMLSGPVSIANVRQPELDQDTNEDLDESDEEEEPRTPPKAIRQVLADLDDEEAARLTGYLDSLDDNEYLQLGRAAESIPSLDERIAWARGLTFTIGEDGALAGVPTAATARPAPAVPPAAPSINARGIPPTLLPVLVQLSPEEQMIGAQILQALDRATIERLTTQLAAMPPERALATVRRTIANAQQRAASVAQRAVMAALADVAAANSTNGGAA